MTNELNDYLYKKNRNYDQLKAEVPMDEAIRLIKSYGGRYDPHFEGLDVWDQLLINEGLSKNRYTQYNPKGGHTDETVSVSGMYNEPSKLHVNFELTQSKERVITQLMTFNYKTPPPKIAACLEEIFKEWPSNAGHWLYVAQNWPPRAINRAMNKMVKQHMQGRVSLKNPPAFFTMLMKHRHPRKR